MPSPELVVEVLERSDGPCLLEVVAAALRLEVDEGALRDADTPEEASQGRAATAAADRDDVDDGAVAGFEDDDDDD